MLGLSLTHVQDPALDLVESHRIHTHPLLKLVQVPLDDNPSLERVGHTTQLGTVSKLPEGALLPALYVTDEDIKQYWSPYEPLRDPTCH